MECDAARRRMSEALDGAAPDVAGHVAGCPMCAREWARLKALDARLRSVSLIDPPPYLGRQVLARIAREHPPEPPRVERAVMQLALVVAGAALTAALIVVQLRLESAPVAIQQFALMLRGSHILAVALASAANTFAYWPLHVGLALAVALAWFGAVVMPRHPVRAVSR